ncbi:hypothetical protein HUW46_09067 [Amycolatopsis sp. CA-230715]|nr:hypothetical protein HUW46_09067 [Amycolatopsis sp. CA-230715]
MTGSRVCTSFGRYGHGGACRACCGRGAAMPDPFRGQLGLRADAGEPWRQVVVENTDRELDGEAVPVSPSSPDGTHAASNGPSMRQAIASPSPGAIDRRWVSSALIRYSRVTDEPSQHDTSQATLRAVAYRSLYRIRDVLDDLWVRQDRRRVPHPVFSDHGDINDAVATMFVGEVALRASADDVHVVGRRAGSHRGGKRPWSTYASARGHAEHARTSPRHGSLGQVRTHPSEPEQQQMLWQQRRRTRRRGRPGRRLVDVNATAATSGAAYGLRRRQPSNRSRHHGHQQARPASQSACDPREVLIRPVDDHYPR